MTPQQMTEPGSAILTKAELDTVLDAVDYAADDLAYRADFEFKSTGDEEQAAAYMAKATAYAQFAARIRERRGNEGEWTR